ncbi:hypothetical protein PNEG_01317 [Pneumocystis murina B123]|uniref:Uncharacterized protein n=1 Tax=Pneumocystis murina (strain B123) TaxID=1069680 RepID=M7PJH6_PNEMU|nr:hypothetical protein PNEG_01317 [Pneumocystis murina B123]EMR10614.1 hypothetical protein PNEG_01317 [Pneumocystis murina B123]
MVSKYSNKFHLKHNILKNPKNSCISRLNIKKKKGKKQFISEKFMKKLDDMTLDLYTLGLMKNSNTLQNIKKKTEKPSDIKTSYLDILAQVENNINSLQVEK